MPEIDLDAFPELSNAANAYTLWQALEGLDWKILLHGGGILDQPEQLFNEVLQIASLSHQVRRMVERERQEAEQHEREPRL